jgi:hypothetical protein
MVNLVLDGKVLIVKTAEAFDKVGDPPSVVSRFLI